jgi:two-component system, chemotaxis family, chemotaxis protein CheY
MQKKVLIVDDSMFMRSMINEALSGAGFEIIGQAANGEEAIEMARKMEPDLITLDNILPDMIGTDILRILKQEDKISSKVIMISAVGQEAVIQEGMNLGASDYIVKPFSSDNLVTAVNKVLA